MEEDKEYNTWAAELNLLDKMPVRLSLKMMIRRHLPPEAESWDQEKIIAELNKITHLRLDRENIKEIDNLELLGLNVTNVYLQRNHISKIDNLGCLSNLMFLMLAGNQIRVVENLTCLSRLSLLDLSDNFIETFDIDEIPQSLVILNLKNNPCTTKPDHRGSIIQELSSLRQLNEVEVSREERMEAGYTVTSSESDEDDTEPVVGDTHQEPLNSAHQKIEREGDDAVKYMANNILLRSQERLEDLMKEHQERAAEMESVRLLFRLPPRSARSGGSAGANI